MSFGGMIGGAACGVGIQLWAMALARKRYFYRMLNLKNKQYHHFLVKIKLLKYFRSMAACGLGNYRRLCWI